MLLRYRKFCAQPSALKKIVAKTLRFQFWKRLINIDDARVKVFVLELRFFNSEVSPNRCMLDLSRLVLKEVLPNCALAGRQIDDKQIERAMAEISTPATQLLSRSARVAGAATQSLRVAEWLRQPLWQSRWVAEWLRQSHQPMKWIKFWTFQYPYPLSHGFQGEGVRNVSYNFGGTPIGGKYCNLPPLEAPNLGGTGGRG